MKSSWQAIKSAVMSLRIVCSMPEANLRRCLWGAETIRPFIKRLLPEAIETRPRLSRLSYGGVRKVTRLQRRSAIVAFSQVMFMRLPKPCAAKEGGVIVMGALSLRTRNKQVEMYQNGDGIF